MGSENKLGKAVAVYLIFTRCAFRYPSKSVIASLVIKWSLEMAQYFLFTLIPLHLCFWVLEITVSTKNAECNATYC